MIMEKEKRVLVNFRLTTTLVKGIDARCGLLGMTRTDYIRGLIESDLINKAGAAKRVAEHLAIYNQVEEDAEFVRKIKKLQADKMKRATEAGDEIK